MKKGMLIGLIIFASFSSTSLCLSDENKGHVCFRVIDSNRDGKVTFQEFSKIFGDDKATFKEIDENGDGNLSHDEYHRSLGHGSSKT